MYGIHVYAYTDHKSLQYVFTQNELNLFHRRWFELLKDYDMTVLYTPGKANMGADALSSMAMDSVSRVEKGMNDLLKVLIGLLDWVFSWKISQMVVLWSIITLGHP